MHKYFTLDSNEEGNESVSQATASVKRNEDSDRTELGGVQQQRKERESDRARRGPNVGKGV